MDFCIDATSRISCRIASTVSLCSFPTSRKQLENSKLKSPNFLNAYALDGYEKVSRDVQSLANNSLILDGSSGNDWRFLQCSTMSLLRWGSRLRLVGTVMKLFLLRSKHSNQDKELRSLGSAPSSRLRSLKFNFFKEHRPDKEILLLVMRAKIKPDSLTWIPLPYILLMIILEALSKE